MGNSNKKYELIHEIVSSEDNILNIKELCSVAGVSRSGYYSWLKAANDRKRHEIQDRKDFDIILEAYSFRGYDKGVRGVHMRLLHMGIVMNQKKIRRLMRKYNLSCACRKPNPYRQMLRSMKTSSIADNLVNREFEDHGPRAILLTDITYIRVHEYFVYLSVIIDAYTKEILSYELSDSLEVDFVLKTVHQLMEKHGHELKTDTIIHSDQGSHYTSTPFKQLIANTGLRQSMSRRGNCWDNAPQESFFGHMKDELKSRAVSWDSLNDVKSDIDDWVDYYNNDRYQWNLAKLSPSEFYQYTQTGDYILK